MKFTTTTILALATLAAASPAHRRDGQGPDHSQGGGVGDHDHGSNGGNNGNNGHTRLGGYGGSHGSSGPCDMSSEDTGCYLISDNSGCFLNTNNVTRVLECVDPTPSVAIDIFCRCWGCNGNELTNFMPMLNCSSHTVIPPKSNATNATTSLTPGFPPVRSTPVSTRLPLSTGTSFGTSVGTGIGTGVGTTSHSTSAPSAPIHGYGNTTTTWATNHTRMPVPIISHAGHY